MRSETLYGKHQRRPWYCRLSERTMDLLTALLAAVAMWLLLLAFAVWATGISEMIASTLEHVIEAFS